MAWIGYEEVKAKWAAVLADPVPCGEFDLTAAQIAETLSACYADEVKTSHEPSVQKIYDAHGHSLERSVTTMRTTYRSLTRDLAERIADGLHSDDTVTHKWCAVYEAAYVQNSGYSDMDFDVFEFTAGPLSVSPIDWVYKPAGKPSSGGGIQRSIRVPTPGRTVTASAARSNEADGWSAIVTTTVYDVPPYTAGSIFWPDVRPQRGTNDNSVTGNVTSFNTRRQFLFSYSGYPLTETTTTTTTEYRNLTYAQAKAIVDGAAAAAWKKAQYRASQSGSASYTMAVRDGTETVADARYVDDERGWTATVASTTYSHNTVSSGAGWYLANL